MAAEQTAKKCVVYPNIPPALAPLTPLGEQAVAGRLGAVGHAGLGVHLGAVAGLAALVVLGHDSPVALPQALSGGTRGMFFGLFFLKLGDAHAPISIRT